MIHGMNIRHDS